MPMPMRTPEVSRDFRDGSLDFASAFPEFALGRRFSQPLPLLAFLPEGQRRVNYYIKLLGASPDCTVRIP